jgi:hypothetical protein
MRTAWADRHHSRSVRLEPDRVGRAFDIGVRTGGAGVSRPPLWRQMYNRVEHAVAPRLEAAVQTDMFASALAAATKARAELDRRRSQVADRLGAVGARGLHLWNLPAAHDVAQLRAEILELDRRVRDLARQLDQAGGEGQADDRDVESGGDAGVDPL